MITATHAFLRKLLAEGRNIQAGIPPDVSGLIDALETWRSTTPAAGGRILALLRGVQSDLKRRNTPAALEHISNAIELVLRVQKQVVARKQADRTRESRSHAKAESDMHALE